MSDVIGIIEQVIHGLSLVGKAVTQGIKLLFNYFGVDLPDYAVTVSTVILLILIISKFGNAVNKIVLFILIFLLLSSLAGFATPFLEC